MATDFEVVSPKKYEGSVYLGMVGSEIENGVCRDSVDNIVMRTGDQFAPVIRGTKGFEARQMHVDRFLSSDCQFLFLVDSDMVFPNDALERLRSHGLPFVSGIYMRRRYQPLCPIWFENGPAGVLPMKIWTDRVIKGNLYEIGASGWGCMLVHRDVFEAVRPLLKGQQFILEDDMDIYPYDLGRIMQAINRIEYLCKESTDGTTAMQLAVYENLKVLKEEIRPLRAGGGDPNVGSDIRFPFFAKLAGFQLVGDTNVACQHMLNYPLSVEDYMTGMSDEQIAELKKQTDKEFEADRDSVMMRLNGLQAKEMTNA